MGEQGLHTYTAAWVNGVCVSGEVISIPGWVVRGAGAATHHEYEVRIALGAARWQLLRRYRRFRDLYLAARRLYGPKVPPELAARHEDEARIALADAAQIVLLHFFVKKKNNMYMPRII